MGAGKTRRQVRVRSVTRLSPTVKSIEFEAVDGQSVGHIAGQWVNLFIQSGGEEIRRSYSIASMPDLVHPERFEVAVTLVVGGPASTALHALTPGEEIAMEGPWGVFTLERRDPSAPMVFVGTGTGVTPLRAMVGEELRQRAEGPPLAVLFGCRTPDEILYREEFAALAAQHPRFHYDMTLSRADDAWAGRRGYVQLHLPEMLEKMGQPTTHVYVCGLSNMVQDVRALLKEQLKLDRKLVHTERYD